MVGYTADAALFRSLGWGIIAIAAMDLRSTLLLSQNYLRMMPMQPEVPLGFYYQRLPEITGRLNARNTNNQRWSERH